MDVPPSIREWVNREFPKPKVDPNWLRGCYDYLCQTLNDNSNTNKICQNISHQILNSKFSDSMRPGTGLPSDFSGMDNTTVKFGPHGILLELVSLSDIGVSAFNQLNTRQARIDRADLAGIALQREETDGGDPEEEGPIPKYQRSMLQLHLSDGVTEIKAIEHKRIPSLELGETPLGIKVILKDVFVRKGIAYLKPECISIKEGSRSDSDDLRDELFVYDLKVRLGQDPGPYPSISQDEQDESPNNDTNMDLLPSNTLAIPEQHSRSPVASSNNIRRTVIADTTPRTRMSPEQLSPFFSDSGTNGIHPSASGPSNRSNVARMPNAATTVDAASESEFGDMDDIIRDFADGDLLSGTRRSSTVVRGSRDIMVAQNPDVINIDSDDDSDQENRPIPPSSRGNGEVVEDLSAYLAWEDVIELSD